ncbi:MAG: DNA-binding protein [Lachnospiraceae bacterium]|nr:DNA-binding protein [Lachnospiraceae bacterium]
MEKIFQQALLYDFYGELLTQHQRSVYEDAVYNDMSLSEIAEVYGISRQGVHDLIKRCDKILAGYEEKLHLVEKFTGAKEKIAQLVDLTKDLELTGLGEEAKEKVLNIRELSTDLMNEF